jgi:uncharacterized membrane protein YkvI
MSAIAMNTNVPKQNVAVVESAPSTAVLSQVGDTLQVVSQQLEGQSLTALSQGFFFAAALSWMDVSRWVIGQFVKGNKNGGIPLTLTAIATTLLSILVFLIISTLSPKVQKPQAPMYAVVGGR